jgi:uncharacterized protein (DUF362 family)/NAD-dependent dihydropyrimidine dehydrogenase PreA subunit
MSHTVALVKCTTYSDPSLRDGVRRAVDLLGGMGQFVRPGQRVLLKPNLVRAAPSGEMVCTHPALVKAVVRLVQEAGGHPVIGDSPGGPFVAPWLRAVYRTSGMAEVARKTGAELNSDFSESRVSHLEGRRIKALEVGNFVINADVVISLPKLKTHGLMQLTGATKNLFGVIPGTIKPAYHAKFPDPEVFGDMLLDILDLIRPALTIMDSVVAMDGQGPSAGDPFPVGALLASTNGVALDVVAACLVGMNVHSILPLRAAVARGLTSGRATDVNIVGDSLSDFRVQGFRAPETRGTSTGIGTLIAQLFKQWFIAAPSSNGNCIGCGTCVKSCPVDAITLTDRRAHMDLDTCIRCYCCHELCPERAIDLRKPWLGRVLS